VSPLLVLIGPSGSGKSTLCRRIVAAARQRGITVGGIAAETRSPVDGAVGLDAVDVATGERVALAEFDRPTGGPATGHWHFHPAAFEAGLSWCRRIPPGSLFVIDELGPLELVQGLGWAGLLPLLQSHAGPVVAVVRPTLVEAFISLTDRPDTTRIDVTPDTREAALSAAMAALGLRS